MSWKDGGELDVRPQGYEPPGGLGIVRELKELRPTDEEITQEGVPDEVKGMKGLFETSKA